MRTETAAPIEIATTDDLTGIRAVQFAFATEAGQRSVTFDRLNPKWASETLPDLTMRAIAAVLRAGHTVETYTTYKIR